ncbi:hypothetical protein EV426DRAFT_700135 [Tirmania nivea]|nr:hypothetical protein EV426DRAFT_700135 [Tirmania nivea]
MDTEKLQLTEFLSSPKLIKITVSAPQVTVGAVQKEPQDEKPGQVAAAEVLHLAPACPSTSSVQTGSVENSTVVLYVHENLLASCSPEVYKLASNDMKANLEGVLDLVLHDVEETVVKKFVEWVYRNDYTEADEPFHFKLANSIMLNVKMYIFGTRYNIASLQQLAMAKVNEELANDSHWCIPCLYPEFVFDIILHAFNSLPTSGLFNTLAHDETHAAPLTDQRGGDKMLRFWIDLMASALPTLQMQTRYQELINNHNICMALLQRGVLDCRPKLPPWSKPSMEDEDDFDDSDRLELEEYEDEEE